MADKKVSALTEVDAPTLDDQFYLVDNPGVTPASAKVSANRLGGAFVPGICDGRLTLTSGEPVTTTNVTGATAVYFTPYVGDRVSLWDGTRWKLYDFSEVTLNLGTKTTDTNYDVFLYDNAGTLTLEALNWSSDTARSVNLVRQDGVLTKTGARDRRYLGTLRTTSTTTTEDSLTKRFLWNMYHRRSRPLLSLHASANWTLGAGITFRELHAGTGWTRLGMVRGVDEDIVTAEGGGLNVSTTTPTSDFVLGIGVGSVTTPSGIAAYIAVHEATGTAVFNTPPASYRGLPGLGYRWLTLLEQNNDGTRAITVALQPNCTAQLHGVCYA